MRGISLHSHSPLCHLTCVFLKHCGQNTLCAELYKTRHKEDADRRGLASDRHSPGPPGLIFGQRYLIGVCFAVSADFRGYLLGYCVIRLQDEEDERKHSKCVTVQACCLHSLCVEPQLSLFCLELALLYDERATLSSSNVFSILAGVIL